MAASYKIPYIKYYKLKCIPNRMKSIIQSALVNLDFSVKIPLWILRQGADVYRDFDLDLFCVPYIILR